MLNGFEHLKLCRKNKEYIQHNIEHYLLHNVIILWIVPRFRQLTAGFLRYAFRNYTRIPRTNSQIVRVYLSGIW